MAKRSSLQEEEQPKETPSNEPCFIVELERPLYNQFTGEKLSKPFQQKFSPGEFALQIQMDAAGVPLICQLGDKINKIIQIPDASNFKGVRVKNHDPKGEERFISLEKGIENLKKYLNI